VMGIDLGTKNIGVALSDETCTLAQGRGVIPRGDGAQAIAKIKEMIKEYGVKEIIVGLPLNMDGSEGPRAADSRKFSERLKEETALPVRLWDERLSTKEAEDVMRQALMTRKKRKNVIDKMAAQLILQGYLDSLRR